MCFTVPQVGQAALRKTEAISKDHRPCREPVFFAASLFCSETYAFLVREYTLMSANMTRHRKCCITGDDLTRAIQQPDFDPLREWIADLGLSTAGNPDVDMLQENIEGDILNFYHSYTRIASKYCVCGKCLRRLLFIAYFASKFFNCQYFRLCT